MTRRPHDGFDDCGAGEYCISRTCEPICDDVGSAKGCDALHACNAYGGLFDDVPGGTIFAGVCDISCDPLTQVARVPILGRTAACGSPITCSGSGSGCGSDGPEAGCYPQLLAGIATCSDTPESRGRPAAEDAQPCDVTHDCDNSSGIPFPNGCAPGYTGFYFEMTGSTQVMCNGLCAPLETDSARPANGPGDGSALGKLPEDAAPVAGHARCTLGGRANRGDEECSYIWPVLAANGITSSPFADTLGVCFSPSQFLYDPTGGSNETKPTPACATLRPGTLADAEAADQLGACSRSDNSGSEADCFAVAHGCYSLEDSTPGSAAAAVHPARAPRYSPLRDVNLAVGDRAPTRRRGGIR